MLLSTFKNLELGNLNPVAFRRAEETKKIFTLKKIDYGVLMPDDSLLYSSYSMAIDPTDQFLLTGFGRRHWTITDCKNTTSNNNDKRCYKTVAKYKEGPTAKRSGYVNSVAWGMDSGLFSMCTRNDNVQIYDSNYSSPLMTYGDRDCYLHASNKINHTILAVSRLENSPAQLSLIDLRIGSFIQSIPVKNYRSCALEWSPVSTNILAVGDLEGHVIEWDIRSTRSHLRAFGSSSVDAFKTHTVPKAHSCCTFSIKYSSDGLMLFTYGDLIVNKFTTLSAKLEESVVMSSHVQSKLQLKRLAIGLTIYAFDGLDTSLLAVPAGKQIFLVDMDTGKVIRNEKLPFNVNGFIYNRSLLRGFCSGESITIFGLPDKSEKAVEEEKSQTSTGGLIDVHDL